MLRSFLLAFFVFTAASVGAEPPVAPKVTLTCVACHGARGLSANPLWPNLAGQKPDYISKQLNDFKEGRRQDPLMTAVAQTLSVDDIKAIAAYFSSL